MDNGTRKIDFKFSKNWKTFMTWYEDYVTRAKWAPSTEDQLQKIQYLFESSNPHIIDWNILWSELAVWLKDTKAKKGIVVWDEQKRQIETLMLNQHSELNKEIFVLAYLFHGKPQIDSNYMTYWDAIRTKKQLEGDANGFGGDERMDKITVVNVSKLLS